MIEPKMCSLKYLWHNRCGVRHIRDTRVRSKTKWCEFGSSSGQHTTFRTHCVLIFFFVRLCKYIATIEVINSPEIQMKWHTYSSSIRTQARTTHTEYTHTQHKHCRSTPRLPTLQTMAQFEWETGVRTDWGKTTKRQNKKNWKFSPNTGEHNKTFFFLPALLLSASIQRLMNSVRNAS